MQNYDLESLASLNLSYRSKLAEVKSTALQMVALGLTSNLDRVVAICDFPIRAINVFNHFVHSQWPQVQSGVIREYMDSSEYAQFREAHKEDSRLDNMYPEDMVHNNHVLHSEYLRLLPRIISRIPNYDESYIEAFCRLDDKRSHEYRFSMKKLDCMVLKSGTMFTNSVATMLESMAVAMWTAFETFAGDLWVETINAHPATLSMLAGQEKRISNLASGKFPKKAKNHNPDPESNDRDSESKLFRLSDIHAITKGQCDLSKCMGVFLKSKVSFQTLNDIRVAFSLAFNPKCLPYSLTDTIDASLSDSALDRLSLVRNLVVHKAGIADRIYTDNSSKLTEDLRLDPGSRLCLTGRSICNLISPVVAASLNLFKAIDNWLSTGRSTDQQCSGEI